MWEIPLKPGSIRRHDIPVPGSQVLDAEHAMALANFTTRILEKKAVWRCENMGCPQELRIQTAIENGP